jgi:hypothetical protein
MHNLTVRKSSEGYRDLFRDGSDNDRLVVTFSVADALPIYRDGASA